MNWDSLLKEDRRWMEDGGGADRDVVILSRIRLARNVVDVPFPARLDKEGQRALLNRVLQAARAAASLSASPFIDLTDLKKVERQFLMERHLISPEMAFDSAERGVVIGEGQKMTLMINEEDHLRLQSFEGGRALEAAWERADRIDSELGEKLSYAFDSEWGFCTRCPTNAGTGLRASCLLHLPALVMNGDIQKVLDGLASAGITARGFYGERSKAFGDLFQISNSTTLGHTEREMIEAVGRAVQGIARYERQGRAALSEAPHRTATEDAVYRSWGILRHARLISYDEAMLILSRVRLGLQIGLPLPVDPAVLNSLMLLTQPAHLQMLSGSALRIEERDRMRAALIREKLGKP